MELSLKERLFLMNQYRILAALYPDEADGYEQRGKAVERGYPSFYGDDWVDPNPLTAEECTETAKIIDMYWHMQNTVRNEGNDWDIGLDEVRFPGFDGNNEKQYGYARYLVEDLGRFGGLVTIQEGSLNSHAPMLDRYRRMLGVWQPILREHPVTLNEDSIREVLAATVP